MKCILIFFYIVLFISCKSGNVVSDTDSQDYLHEVKSIDSINNWYVIYSIKNDTIYKIVSKKENAFNSCKRIKTGKKYSFYLISKNESPPVINGVKLQPQNYLDVNCFSFDEKTNICIEPEKGIYKLSFAENLKGLCLEGNIGNVP